VLSIIAVFMIYFLRIHPVNLSWVDIVVSVVCYLGFFLVVKKAGEKEGHQDGFVDGYLLAIRDSNNPELKATQSAIYYDLISR
jgi:hypothetical protein